MARGVHRAASREHRLWDGAVPRRRRPSRAVRIGPDRRNRRGGLPDERASLRGMAVHEGAHNEYRLPDVARGEAEERADDVRVAEGDEALVRPDLPDVPGDLQGSGFAL